MSAKHPPCSQCGDEPARALRGGLGSRCYQEQRRRDAGAEPAERTVRLGAPRVSEACAAALQAESERLGRPVYQVVRAWLEERARR